MKARTRLLSLIFPGAACPAPSTARQGAVVIFRVTHEDGPVRRRP